jgi:hypothetical protein
VELFGFSIKRIEDPVKEQEKQKSFAPPTTDDGAVNILAGGTMGGFVDLDGSIRTEAELVSKYREMSLQPEMEKAINEVVNEAIVTEDDDETVELNMEEMELPDKIKNVINAEFEYILKLLNFDKYGYDIFKRWYVDGRHYYHVIIDETQPLEGIKELRYVDPRKIRKIREVLKRRDPNTGAILQITKAEYFIYSDKGLNAGRIGSYSGSGQSIATTGLKIANDSVIHTTSGLMDTNNSMALSYLHSAIKPLNMLRALEDATLIYHLSRAPERRIFKVEVGNLPRHKAEQYVYDMMTKHKNKVAYNTQDGKITDQRHFPHMLEDYWLPTREGRGTEIDILQGGTQLPQLLESLEYFQDRLYRALQVPLTRMKPDAIYNIGRATEITRDEVNFQKFIDRVRNKFSEFLLDALGRQLVLKNLMLQEEWDSYKNDIQFKWARDNYFAELKESEILNERFLRVRDIDDFVGKYVSAEYVRRNILRFSDDDIKEQDAQIQAEWDNPQFNLQLKDLQFQQEYGVVDDAQNQGNPGSSNGQGNTGA